MTRSEEAIEGAAALLFEERTEVPWRDADESVRSPWIRNARITVAAYEAHMRPVLNTFDELDELPDTAVVLDGSGSMFERFTFPSGTAYWRPISYSATGGNFRVTLPARVIHWGADS